MFKNLNLEDKIRILTRINQIFLILIGILAVLGIYNVRLNYESYLNYSIVLAVSILLGVVISELFRNWIDRTVSSYIYKAVLKTNSASGEIIKETVQQDTFIGKHLQLLKETSLIIEKLKISSQKTKDSALEVAEKSQESLDLSSKEQLSVKSNIDKMKTLKQKIEIIAELILELSEHTQQIGSIIGVVEDITEQTNMLALNAAVEAARAGEHGKGFAVVASEIRKLADESKQATTKITSLIYDIQQATNSTVMATEEGTKEIETGVDLAHQIATSIEALRTTIKETVMAVDNIVEDTDQQLDSTEDVQNAIQQIDKDLYKSAEKIKQNLKALKELLSVSESLKTNIFGADDVRTVKSHKELA